MHHGIADQLDCHVLDRRLIPRRHQMHADAVEHHGLVVLVRHQFGQRRERAVQAPRLRNAVGFGRVGFLRHLG